MYDGLKEYQTAVMHARTKVRPFFYQEGVVDDSGDLAVRQHLEIT